MLPHFKKHLVIVNYMITRESVARVANFYYDKNSRHDKKLVFKFGKYLYHRYIYKSIPPPPERKRMTDVTDCQLKE